MLSYQFVPPVFAALSCLAAVSGDWLQDLLFTARHPQVQFGLKQGWKTCCDLLRYNQLALSLSQLAGCKVAQPPNCQPPCQCDESPTGMHHVMMRNCSENEIEMTENTKHLIQRSFSSYGFFQGGISLHHPLLRRMFLSMPIHANLNWQKVDETLWTHRNSSPNTQSKRKDSRQSFEKHQETCLPGC